jgi:hypothetical protein
MAATCRQAMKSVSWNERKWPERASTHPTRLPMSRVLMAIRKIVWSKMKRLWLTLPLKRGKIGGNLKNNSLPQHFFTELS